ncbi:sigma factor-like helix-turn-helix DNA-binding protein [Actinomadura violacea]
MMLAHQLDLLPEREGDVLRHRIGIIDDRAWTLEEIGRLHGVSREQVRQLVQRALTGIRSLIPAEFSGEGDHALATFPEKLLSTMPSAGPSPPAVPSSSAIKDRETTGVERIRHPRDPKSIAPRIDQCLRRGTLLSDRRLARSPARGGVSSGVFRRDPDGRDTPPTVEACRLELGVQATSGPTTRP